MRIWELRFAHRHWALLSMQETPDNAQLPSALEEAQICLTEKHRPLELQEERLFSAAKLEEHTAALLVYS